MFYNDSVIFFLDRKKTRNVHDFRFFVIFHKKTLSLPLRWMFFFISLLKNEHFLFWFIHVLRKELEL